MNNCHSIISCLVSLLLASTLLNPVALQAQQQQADRASPDGHNSETVQGTLAVDGREIRFGSLNELELAVNRLKSEANSNTEHVNVIAHFAIYADDLDRARKFYESVFQWEFSTWNGQAAFYQIDTGTESLRGALQQRPKELAGKGFNGFECSIAVADIQETTRSIKEHGGKILVDEVEIPRVGRFIKFADTEGNIAGAVQYYDGVR